MRNPRSMWTLAVGASHSCCAMLWCCFWLCARSDVTAWGNVLENSTSSFLVLQLEMMTGCYETLVYSLFPPNAPGSTGPFQDEKMVGEEGGEGSCSPLCPAWNLAPNTWEFTSECRLGRACLIAPVRLNLYHVIVRNEN